MWMTANTFGIHQCTVSNVVFEVCEAITKHLGPEYIHLPRHHPLIHMTTSATSSFTHLMCKPYVIMPAIHGDITPVKTDKDREKCHVPEMSHFLCVSKDYDQFRLPGHSCSVNMDEVIPQSLPRKQHRSIPVESHRFRATSNVSIERKATLTDKSPVAMTNNSSWLAEKFRSVTHMDIALKDNKTLQHGHTQNEVPRDTQYALQLRLK
ncbi:hypothetical protein ACROYT_G014422 [Oculina patagonica]